MFSLHKIITLLGRSKSSGFIYVKHPADKMETHWRIEYRNNYYTNATGRNWRMMLYQENDSSWIDYTMRIVIELIDRESEVVLHREKPVDIVAKELREDKKDNNLTIAEMQYKLLIKESMLGNEKLDSNKEAVLRIIIFTKQQKPAITSFRHSSCQCGSLPLVASFKQLFNDKESTDIIVKGSDGIEIHVHKLPLTALSSVFKTMFNIDMTEKQSAVVEIKDFDSKVLNELFRFIYCNEAELNEEIVGDLLVAAKRYEIAVLPDICAKFIIENFEDVDIWPTLQLAHVYDLKELFEFIASIFFADYNFYSNQTVWKDLCDVHLKLKVSEFFNSLYFQNSKFQEMWHVELVKKD